MTNLYEVTYKTSLKARKLRTAIRCGASIEAASLLIEDAVIVSVRYIGEHCGDWCQR